MWWGKVLPVLTLFISISSITLQFISKYIGASLFAYFISLFVFFLFCFLWRFVIFHVVSKWCPILSQQSRAHLELYAMTFYRNIHVAQSNTDASQSKFFNFLGCTAEELGVRVPSPKRIPDRYMTSSSHQSSSYQAFRGRIGLESRGSWGNAWCASESDSDPYIQIFFRKSFKFGYKTPFLILVSWITCLTYYHIFQEVMCSGIFINAIDSKRVI